MKSQKKYLQVGFQANLDAEAADAALVAGCLASFLLVLAGVA